MAESISYRIRTDKNVQWTGALAQNAGANENISVPWSNKNMELTLIGITVVSDQNLSWEFDFWNSTLFGSSSDMNLDGWIGYWAFDSGTGQQIGATGSYRQYVDGLEIPLYDINGLAQMHVTLVNRSATGKNPGATGEIVVTFHVQGQQVGGA